VASRTTEANVQRVVVFIRVPSPAGPDRAAGHAEKLASTVPGALVRPRGTRRRQGGKRPGRRCPSCVRLTHRLHEDDQRLLRMEEEIRRLREKLGRDDEPIRRRFWFEKCLDLPPIEPAGAFLPRQREHPELHLRHTSITRAAELAPAPRCARRGSGPLAPRPSPGRASGRRRGFASRRSGRSRNPPTSDPSYTRIPTSAPGSEHPDAKGSSAKALRVTTSGGGTRRSGRGSPGR